jgi:hypothetical protein
LRHPLQKTVQRRLIDVERRTVARKHIPAAIADVADFDRHGVGQLPLHDHIERVDGRRTLLLRKCARENTVGKPESSVRAHLGKLGRRRP